MKLYLQIVLLLSFLALHQAQFTFDDYHEEIGHVHLGPYENRTNDSTIDYGHRLLIMIAQQEHGFKEMLGINFTGKELICNCSSTYCVSDGIRFFLERYGLYNTCIGRVCYRQKRYKGTYDGEWKVDDHSGCYGLEKTGFDDEFAQQHLLCKNTKTSLTSCCSQSFCQPDVGDPPDEEYKKFLARRTQNFHDALVKWILISIGIFLVICLVVGGVLLFKYWKRVKLFATRCGLIPKPLFRRRNYEMNNEELQTMTTSDGHQQQHSEEDMMDQLALDLDQSWDDSGSGSGPAQMTRKDITRMIKLQDLIGTGRYGKVYVGIYQGRKVAVKISESHDAKTHESELAAYLQDMIRHENVLEFLAHGVHDTGSTLIERWLVTAYHETGSLFDYLHKETINTTQLMKMVRSFACGVAFLHTEIPGTGGKEPIAHRDIKSSNILLTPRLTCVVADLGLAVRPIKGEREQPVSVCGTVRYLAPEILDEAMETTSFESYKFADIYAMALVIWEMCRRTECEEGPVATPEESIPYFDSVDRDPSIEEMREVVYNKGIRPLVPDFWQKNMVLEVVSRIVRESWRTNPQSRLTATYMRNAMDRLATKLNLHDEVLYPHDA